MEMAFPILHDLVHQLTAVTIRCRAIDINTPFGISNLRTFLSHFVQRPGGPVSSTATLGGRSPGHPSGRRHRPQRVAVGEKLVCALGPRRPTSLLV